MRPKIRGAGGATDCNKRFKASEEYANKGTVLSSWLKLATPDYAARNAAAGAAAAAAARWPSSSSSSEKYEAAEHLPLGGGTTTISITTTTTITININIIAAAAHSRNPRRQPGRFWEAHAPKKPPLCAACGGWAGHK
jgi:hypothetical protein